jgi:hypothetical protein
MAVWNFAMRVLRLMVPLLFATALVAAEAPTEGVTVTIYNAPREANQNPQRWNRGYQVQQPSGWAVVKDRRKLNLAKGRSAVQVTDVAAAIVPASVRFNSLTDPAGTVVLDQNFLYDLASVPTLLRRFTDAQVTVVREKGGQFQGTLLSTEESRPTWIRTDGGGNELVQQTSLIVNVPNEPDPVRFEEFRELALPALPGGLVTRPTLSWQVQAARAGEQLAEITYITDHCTWRADYILRVNPAPAETLDLSGWATIENESGASFPNARLKLMGGDVQRLPEETPEAQNGFIMEKPRGSLEELEAFTEKSFFEYHLYTLGRATTLPDNSKKQIELFPPASGVPYRKVYVYKAGSFRENNGNREPMIAREFGTLTNTKVDTYLEFKNDEAAHLGMPLPAGRVRVYLRVGADTTGEFIGEDEIKHTPTDEFVRLALGSAFDITGERKQVGFQIDERQKWMLETFEIRLRNHKPEAVTVEVDEQPYRWMNWWVKVEAFAYEKLDARTARFKVPVPANGEAVLTYTVGYDW